MAIPADGTLARVAEREATSASAIQTQTDQFLTATQAADLLGIKPSTLAAWRCLRSDGPPFSKIGSAVRYRRGALIEWVQARTARSTGGVGNEQ